jgi:hypothetical protein
MNTSSTTAVKVSTTDGRNGKYRRTSIFAGYARQS